MVLFVNNYLCPSVGFLGWKVKCGPHGDSHPYLEGLGISGRDQG